VVRLLLSQFCPGWERERLARTHKIPAIAMLQMEVVTNLFDELTWAVAARGAIQ
jgi:hypothetical protein